MIFLDPAAIGAVTPPQIPPSWTDVVIALTGIANLLLLGAYVLSTIFTFKQIKKQTDLQSQPYLRIAKSITARPATVGTSHVDPAVEVLHEKWKGILKDFAPKAIELGAQQFLSLTLRNRGKADVEAWTLSLTLIIDPGPLGKRRNVAGEKHTWTIESKGAGDLVEQGDDVIVDVAPLSWFPSCTITWSIEYVDAAKTRYTAFSGDRSEETANKFVTEEPAPAGA